MKRSSMIRVFEPLIGKLEKNILINQLIKVLFRPVVHQWSNLRINGQNIVIENMEYQYQMALLHFN